MIFTSQNVRIHTTDFAFMCRTPAILHSYIMQKTRNVPNDNNPNDYMFFIKSWAGNLAEIMKDLSKEQHDEVVNHYYKIWDSL